MMKLFVKGAKNRLRLFFYFVAVLSIVILSLSIFCACNDDENAETVANDSDEVNFVTFVLNNEEDDIICYMDEYAPTCTKDGKYISAWCVDEALYHEISFDMVCDLLEGDNLTVLAQNGYKLYAKWSDLKNMTGVTMPDISFIYNGQAHRPTVNNAPENANVDIDGEYVDAGEYTVGATVSAYGYKDLRLSCKLTIEKAVIDMSSVKLEDKTFVCDGEEKTLLISGALPDGVSVTYENNIQKEVGKYLVTAHFEAGKNYADIEDMHAFLEIEAKKFKIVFHEEDGSTHEITVCEGDDLSDCDPPKAKKGYLAKWSEADYENAQDSVNVTAVYTPINYGITYELDGGELSGDIPQSYTIEDEVSLPVPVRRYFEFVGWYTSDDVMGVKVTEIPENSTGEKTFFARWTPKKYKVVFETDGGANPDENQTDDGEYEYTALSEPLTLADPVKKGFTFLHWEDEQGIEVSEITADVPKNMTLFARWEAVVYTIAYEYNGAHEPVQPIENYTVETEAFDLPKLVRKGYNFLGWYEDDSCLGKIISSFDPKDFARDIVFYAKWEECVYDIRYELDGGENSALNPTSYKYLNEDIQLGAASKFQYNFLGWFDNAEFEGAAIDIIDTDLCKPLVLYAKFERIPMFTTAMIDGKHTVTGYNAQVYGNNVIIPEEIDRLKVDAIEGELFADAVTLEIRARLTNIPADLLKGCSQLTTLILPDSITKLYDGMLSDCISIESVTVPFAGLTEFDSETVGTYIPFCALFASSDPSGGRNLYEVPMRKVSVSESAGGFQISIIQTDIIQKYVPKTLKEVNICKGSVARYGMSYLTSIEKVSFLGCTKLIEQCAFRGCTKLAEVSLPPALTSLPPFRYSMDGNAFVECTALKVISADVDEEGAFKLEIEAAMKKTFGENWERYVKIEWRNVDVDTRP